MRSLASLTILGTLALAGAAYAQSFAEHAAAAAGATVGTVAGKPLSNALNKVFGDVDKASSTAAKGKTKTTKTATETKPIPDSEKLSPVGTPNGPEPTQSGGSLSLAGGGASEGGGHAGPVSRASASRARRPAAAQLAPIEPPAAVETPAPVPQVKEPSAAELASLQVGATEKDMLASLGVPESRVSIPDDDGHLRETCQYWAQGRPLGTVRLDNGQVVQVLVRNQ